jgi:hypothetical protein
MKKYIFLIGLLFQCIVNIQANLDLVIKKCSKPAKIDGIIDNNDPWTENWIPVGLARSTNQTSAMNANFQMTYDNINLYILVKVKDPTPGNIITEYTWLSDCVEFFISMDTNSGPTGAYKKGDFFIRKLWGNPTPIGLEEVIDPNLKVVEIDESDTYIQEWQFPWSTLSADMSPAWDKSEFKFDIQVSDNTTNTNTGRTQQMYWHSNLDDEWFDTRKEGIITLRSLASICMVTVNNLNKNVIIWQKPVDPSPDFIYIFKESNSQTNKFENIDKISNSDPSIYVDINSDVAVQSNKYRISAEYDGIETKQCSEHKTMHLNINKGQNNSWNLIWEQYEGIEVSSYKIYRGSTISSEISELPEFVQIGSTSGGSISYTDFSAPEGNVFYQIEVVFPFSCSTLKSTSYSSSRSNIASNTKLPLIDRNVQIDFNIYPNPTNYQLFINNLSVEIKNIKILTIDGKVMYSCSSSKKSDVINVRTLPNGMYILKFDYNSYQYLTKFIKY